MPDSAVRKPKKTVRESPVAVARDLRGCIPQVAPAQAEALRGLFAAPRHWPLGDGAALHFTPLSPGSEPAADETFYVDAEGTRLRLRLETANAGQPGPSGLHWSDYRGRARLLAWSLAHERPLMRLSELLGTSLLPQDAAEDDAAGDDAVWLAFTPDAGPDAGPDPLRGAMRFPTGWLSRLQARAEPVYEDDPLPRLDTLRDLPVPVLVGFDGPRLPLADWDALRPGDVVLMGNGSRPPLQARTARFAWPLAAAPDGWRIAAAAQPRSSSLEPSTMNDESPNDAPGTEADIDAGGDAIARDLPVQLAFDIGRIEIGIGDFAALQPGYVFALPAQLQGANVTIRANGRTAGRGEVVAVGDTLGVRLLAWE
ncbi:MAG: type III secretion system cytoplasmic ring protein SctQ [Luteimonas sp.]|nr:type III secretion system cytoplasmic ring protein SctQ [Luteimonas sp.]